MQALRSLTGDVEDGFNSLNITHKSPLAAILPQTAGLSKVRWIDPLAWVWLLAKQIFRQQSVMDVINLPLYRRKPRLTATPHLFPSLLPYSRAIAGSNVPRVINL